MAPQEMEMSSDLHKAVHASRPALPTIVEHAQQDAWVKTMREATADHTTRVLDIKYIGRPLSHSVVYANRGTAMSLLSLERRWLVFPGMPDVFLESSRDISDFEIAFNYMLEHQGTEK